jgi:hypothetical protein
MATYYVGPSGNNSRTLVQAQNSGTPWATLSYACSQVSSNGDIISILAGTINDNSSCTLANGVSIEGVQGSSIIRTNYSSSDLDSGYIVTSSGTNASHISGIYFDGNSLTGSTAIVISRSNVHVFNSTIINFWLQGVVCRGNGNQIGNKVYNCIITNSGGRSADEQGNVGIRYQTGFEMYGCTITQTKRNSNEQLGNVGINAGTGHCVYTEDFVFASKIHDNILWGTNQNESGHYSFTMEFWCVDKTQLGHGTEIYNNTIRGEVDISSAYKGSYSYSFDFHNNIHGYDLSDIPSDVGNTSVILLQFEETMDDVIIRNNTFKNADKPIYFCSNGTSGTVNNLLIYNNIFQNIYYTYGSAQPIEGGFAGWGVGICIGGGSEMTGTLSNIKICNNNFISWTGGISAMRASNGIVLTTSPFGVNGLYVQNNIFQDFAVCPVGMYRRPSSGSVSNFYVQNNLYYNNATNALVISPAGFTTPSANNGHQVGAPSFVSSTDYHLQAGSLAINNGLTIAEVLTDISGANRSIPYEIGVYEYGSGSVLPSVTTTAITSITSTTATSGGNVTSQGSSTVTARGICWSTSINPTTSNSNTVNGSGVGSFTSFITGLTQSTVYYVRAYATNSVGTAYGNNIQFSSSTPVILPTVTTSAVTNVSYTTADANGNLTNNGGDVNTLKGTCFATHTIPTISDNVGGNVTGIGSFVVGMTGLTVTTTYYVRAWATNSAGTSYGAEVSFTTLTPSIPTLTTNAITSIAQTTAISGGAIISNGGGVITSKGVCWSTSQNPTISLSTKTSDGTGSSGWSSNISGLTANTIYYVRAYATNSTGTGYGNQISFTSSPTSPTVSTTSISFVTDTTAISGGNITDTGGATITNRGVCWGESPSPTISNSFTSDGVGTGIFISTLSGLTQNTTYYVRAYATNSAGTSYGSQLSLTTLVTSAYIGIPNARVHKVSTITIGDDTVYSDWFLPSLDELDLINTNLFLYSLGNFLEYPMTSYNSSSEQSATSRWTYSFNGGGDSATNKTAVCSTRAIRTFTSSTIHNLRDIGPGSGYIFYIDGNTYYEAAETDLATSTFSNVTSTAVTGTSQAVGTGLANTLLIIAQPTHTASAAKLCDDLNNLA